MSIEPHSPKEIPPPHKHPDIKPVKEPDTPLRPRKEPEIPQPTEPYIPDSPEEIPSED